MQYQPLGDDKWRVFLRMEEFKQLINCAKHQRARTAMFLMAISLRVQTAATLLVGQFYQDDNGIWWMHIEAKDATERDRETKPREVWVPQAVIDEVEEHLGGDLDSFPEDKPVFDAVKRTLQRDVEDARENAAIATGNENYYKVSSHDLRRYYASHYMFRLGVDRHVTRQMGGWKRVEHMTEYLLLPRDLLMDRLSDAAVLGENPLMMTNSGPADRIDANFNTIDYISYQVDSDEVNQTVQEWLVELGEKVAGVRVVLKERDVGKRDTDESETHDSSRQGSFTADFLPEEGGIATSAPIAELAYVLFLISCSWMVTLAPLF